MSTVITVENLGKKYTLQHQQREQYTALRDVISDGLKKLIHPLRNIFSPLPPVSQEDFWALKDVYFEVNQGDRIGIIGRNGAGKSTLLKILSRITEPTTGSIRIRGRVASLLEVGTGFHPELTGRENIFLNGAILGMGRAEIRNKFDEIVDFAEIEKFLDTPVKRYSSGMYVRLAFAVAAHLEPEILIVDEVLAVGDAQFQKKCLGKMEDVSVKEGRTVLFVSHNMSVVAGLCRSALLLDSGFKVFAGPVRETINQYLLTAGSQMSVDLSQFIHGGPGEYARLQTLELFDAAGTPCSIFSMGGAVVVRLGVLCCKKILDFEVGVKISSWTGVAVHYFVSTWEGMHTDLVEGTYLFEVTIPQIMLLPGKYLIGAWVMSEGNPADDNVQEITAIEVLGSDVSGHRANFDRYTYSGCEVYAPCDWRTVEAHPLRGA